MINRKKKILITLNNTKFSGIENFSYLLAKYIDKNIYEIVIAIPGEGPVCDIFSREDIKYYIFNEAGKKPYSFKGAFNLFKYMIQGKFDIVHAQAGIVPCILGKFLGVKLILEHKHGLDFTEEFIKNMKYFKLILEKLKKYFVDFTLTGCNNDRKILISKFKYEDERVLNLYNGIELSNVSCAEKDGTIRIGTIGRLTYQKGQEYFIEMAKLLTGKGYKCDFVIYGDGENYDFYNSLIDKYNLSDTVFLKGYSNDVNQILNTLDIFVLSSRYEGIPYVILEAMERKIPVISTNVGGINEVIKNHKNGILVDKENPELLSEAVEKLLLNAQLRKTLVDNAYSDLVENYTIRSTIENIEKIYKINI